MEPELPRPGHPRHRLSRSSDSPERGTCSNRRTVLRNVILARVLDGLKHQLLTPALVEVFVAEYVAETNRRNQAVTINAAKLRGELARLERQIKTMVHTIADTGGSRAIVDELRRLERRQDEVTTEMVSACRSDVKA